VNIDVCAEQALAAWDRAALLERWTLREPGFGLPEAYAVAHAVRQRRMQRGEHVRGYKIGFTNRSLWPKYGVDAPLWGTVWDTTLRLLEGTEARTILQGLVQPRLEPEIVFGFCGPAHAGMNDDELVRCVEWVAHGFEIVHAHFDQWRFGVADAAADGGLHARLLVGPRVPIAAFARPAAELTALELELWCDDVCVDRGRGSAVLDGPLAALRTWLNAMAQQPHGWSVTAGDVVTTGTLTDAWPLRPGQVWRTRLSDARLAGLCLRVDP